MDQRHCCHCIPALTNLPAGAAESSNEEDALASIALALLQHPCRELKNGYLCWYRRRHCFFQKTARNQPKSKIKYRHTTLKVIQRGLTIAELSDLQENCWHCAWMFDNIGDCVNHHIKKLAPLCPDFCQIQSVKKRCSRQNKKQLAGTNGQDPLTQRYLPGNSSMVCLTSIRLC